MNALGWSCPESTEGIKQFQSDIGTAETGELTFGQWQELRRRLTRFGDTPVYVYAGGFCETYVFVLEGYVSVEGTWILEDEQIAYPINKAIITCDRDRRGRRGRRSCCA